MNPAGVIITYVDWSDWKHWFFNIPLFLFQLTFMVVGTAIGKIKWPERKPDFIDWIIVVTFIPLALLSPFIPLWLHISMFFAVLVIGIVIIRGINWAIVWRAAQASHVRLVLRQKSWFLCFDGDPKTNFEGSYVANFGYPKMEIQPWRESWNDGKRFEYREPTFTFPQKAIDEMIHYANDQVGKPYDELQLLSPVLNFITWLFRPSLWGQEKIQWTNRPGGLEFCSSGVAACLQWAVKAIYTIWFFLGYDTAMVMPCMFVISEKWRKGE